MMIETIVGVVGIVVTVISIIVTTISIIQFHRIHKQSSRDAFALLAVRSVRHFSGILPLHGPAHKKSNRPHHG